MEDNRKFELGDEAMEQVAGGTEASVAFSYEEFSYLGSYWRDIQYPCNQCGKDTAHAVYRFGGPYSWGVCKVCKNKITGGGRSFGVTFDINTA